MESIKELEALKNLNIEQAVTAIIADDPDAAAIADDLTAALLEAKSGKFGRVTQFPVSSIAETRHKAGLSQAKYAAALNISQNTLKSWESGKRQPSGAAAVLLQLLAKHPELIKEIHGA